MGLRLLRPDRKMRPTATATLAACVSGSSRSTRPSKANSISKNTAPGPLTGVPTRVAQRLLAMAAGIWRNGTTGSTSKRSLTAYDH
jgi:hypothetical protein